VSGDILIPTAGSLDTETVIEHAVPLAEAHGARRHGLYVVNTAALTIGVEPPMLERVTGAQVTDRLAGDVRSRRR